MKKKIGRFVFISVSIYIAGYKSTCSVKSYFLVYYRHDLMTILVEVNNQVAAANANMDDKLYKQIPAPLVTLRKRVFFK